MSPTKSEDFGIDIATLSGVTQDSRAVKPGYLFAALSGTHVDGRDYIDAAIESGATAILCDKDEVKSVEGVDFIPSDFPRKTFSHIVARYYGAQPDNVIAVTGTNGKSSVVHFVNQMLHAIGEPSDFIGTLSSAMTTPDPVSLHEMLANMKKDGVSHVALEASSHGLSQYRLDGVQVDVAAFTSFSQDHLDYHRDMDQYLTAKLRLFEEILPLSGTAVLNADSSAYQDVQGVCKRRGLKTISYGLKGQDVQLKSHSVNAHAQAVTLSVMGTSYDLTVPMVGLFQIKNVLCALACVLALYPDQQETLVCSVETLDAVPGRLQHVQSGCGSYHAFVDYAHTPEALENVLVALRPHAKGRLICVFGCGGDRDRDKRPKMGRIAADLADVVIVTDDNPRSEKPGDIREDILIGIVNKAHTHEVDGRRIAIERAASIMTPDDVLLVAGKGHEQGQIFDGCVEPFDDVTEIETAFLSFKHHSTLT